MTCLLEASAEELPLHCTDCSDSLSLRPYPVNFSSKGSPFSFSEDPIGVERPSLKGSLLGYCVSVLGCSVSVFLFNYKADGKPEASEHDYGPLLPKWMKEVPAMIARQSPRAAATTSIRNFKAALPLLECRQVSY